jgi:hypothetical protein
MYGQLYKYRSEIATENMGGERNALWDKRLKNGKKEPCGEKNRSGSVILVLPEMIISRILFS